MIEKLKEYKECFEKNQFNILLYFGINFILLLIINNNFSTIKIVLEKIINILCIINIEKIFDIKMKNINMFILIFLMCLIIISISVTLYRMINKNINKLFIFGCCILSFQILSIQKIDSNIVNTKIIGILSLLVVLLLSVNLISNEIKNNIVKVFKFILNILIFIMVIVLMYYILNNQKDILIFFKEREEVITLKYMYLIFKIMIIFIVILVILINVIKFLGLKESNNIKDELFPTRIENIEKLEKDIKHGKNSILINNDWGNGKTFFIKNFIEKYDKKYEFIYIKVPYFDTKTEFRKKILSEIHRIFKKNKIITYSLRDLMSYFNINDEDIKLGFINFNFNKLLNDDADDDYREVLINLRDNLNYLEKKVVIILDDFDRIENKKQILEVLNFIGELNIELNESITLITLSSYEKLVSIIEEDKENITEGRKRLEKYFDKIFYLSNPNFFELIDFFSNIYDISSNKREILKGIINLINEQDKGLLANEKINFRNTERLIKNIKEINTKGLEYETIYEKVYIFWEVVELLISDYWDDLKKNENSEIKIFYNHVLQQLIWSNKLPKIKLGQEKEFIFSILESVKKYKLGEYDKTLSYYINIKNEMLKNYVESEIVEKWKYEDYLNINEIFNFEIEERKKIFNFFMLNKNINKYETLELMISYKLNYNWKYKSSMEFFKNLKNKEEGELPSDKRMNGKFYIFLKNLLLVNLFIDINKMEKLKEKEENLYNENIKTKCFLASDIQFLYFFKIFLRKNIEKREYDNFVQEICKTRKIIEQNIVNNDRKVDIVEELKSEITSVKYLEEELTQDIEKLNSLKREIGTLGKDKQVEILEYLKSEDILLYEMWIEYLSN